MNFFKISVCALLCTCLIMPAVSGEEQDVYSLSPLSSLVSVVSQREPIPQRVKRFVDQYSRGTLDPSITFPLPNKINDSVRSLDQMTVTVVAKWLDQLTADDSVYGPRFGSNADFTAFFGDGWDADWTDGTVGSSPQFTGASNKGWIWVNHEYISNNYATPTSAPTGQNRTLADFLAKRKILENDINSDTWEQTWVDTFIVWSKKQHGGSWFRIEKNTAGQWFIVHDENAKRYDATSDTLTAVVGFDLSRNSWDDAGNPLPTNVAPGITGDCSGGMTPWGTIFTAEENVQFYYGDLETAWTSRNRFISGAGFDPGAVINYGVESASSDFTAFGRHSDPNQRKDRDNYGFLVEIDPGQEPSNYYVSVKDGGDGTGHRKVGSMGRVRWENATFYVGSDWNLVPNQPVVIYGANDRRSGRIYKWVSKENYVPGMTKAQVRALVDEGDLYVAHLAGLDHTTGITLYDANTPGGIIPTEEAPGQGQWIRMALDNQTDIAPNAPALGPGTTVGQALADVNWNSIGGYATQNQVLATLFTAANKLGVAETNRPEDVEYNPNDPSGTPRIYVAFTNHTRSAANNQDGVLDDTTPSRQDRLGTIFALQEANPANAGASLSFSYFRVWTGSTPEDHRDPGLFNAATPDNLLIDQDGGVYFGTDGNAGSTGDTRADAIYYLDLDPAHKEGAEGVVNPTFGLPFRLVAGPGDSEATGPWFTPDQRTLFFNVQHPGEDLVRTPSTWPQNREAPKNKRTVLFKGDK